MSLRSGWINPYMFTTVVVASDPYTKLLLHFDGANNSTTFTDSSQYNITVNQGNSGTGANNAAIVTTQSKYGGSCLGSSAGPSTYFYVYTSPSTNLVIGASDFTIEFWYKFVGNGMGNGRLMSNSLTTYSWVLHGPSSGSYGGLMESQSGVVVYALPSTLGWNDTTLFHHYAYVRSGNSLRAYTDGVGGTAVTLPNAYVFDSNIGTNGAIVVNNYKPDNGGNGALLQGFFDEIRVSIGIARYSGDSFTVPTSAFTSSLVVAGITTPGSYPPSGFVSPSPITIGGITYTISTSSFANPAWLSVDYITSSGWYSANNHYNTSTGLYITSFGAQTIADGNTYNGDWLQLQLSSPIKPTSYFMTVQGVGTTDVNAKVNPANFVLLASNDGLTWTLINSQTGFVWPTLSMTFTSSASTSYTYFRHVTTKNYLDSGGCVAIFEFRLII